MALASGLIGKHAIFVIEKKKKKSIEVSTASLSVVETLKSFAI
jgi:hypothetical protein